ncbi:hypothetical protein ACFQV4_18505 [Streptomyces thermocarboxydus]
MNWDDTNDTAASERLVESVADREDQAVEAALRPRTWVSSSARRRSASSSTWCCAPPAPAAPPPTTCCSPAPPASARPPSP